MDSFLTLKRKRVGSVLWYRGALHIEYVLIMSEQILLLQNRRVEKSLTKKKKEKEKEEERRRVVTLAAMWKGQVHIKEERKHSSFGLPDPGSPGSSETS